VKMNMDLFQFFSVKLRVLHIYIISALAYLHCDYNTTVLKVKNMFVLITVSQSKQSIKTDHLVSKSMLRKK